MKKDKLPKTVKEIEALRIALGLCGILANLKTTCLILEVFKKVQEVGGDFSIHDAVTIKYDVEKKYEISSVVGESEEKTKQ